MNATNHIHGLIVRTNSFEFDDSLFEHLDKLKEIINISRLPSVSTAHAIASHSSSHPQSA